MADNTVLNPGSGGVTVGDDDISGVKYQRIKLIHGVDGTNDGDVSRSNPLPVAGGFSTRSDTYTTAANGTTVDCSTKPVRRFALQVKGTGAAATAWEVVIEGSLNNAQFTTIITHTSVADSEGEFRNAADGETLFVDTGAPWLYFRSRLVSITLSPATNVIATIVGQS